VELIEDLRAADTGTQSVLKRRAKERERERSTSQKARPRGEKYSLEKMKKKNRTSKRK